MTDHDFITTELLRMNESFVVFAQHQAVQVQLDGRLENTSKSTRREWTSAGPKPLSIQLWHYGGIIYATFKLYLCNKHLTS